MHTQKEARAAAALGCIGNIVDVMEQLTGIKQEIKIQDDPKTTIDNSKKYQHHELTGSVIFVSHLRW